MAAETINVMPLPIPGRIGFVRLDFVPDEDDASWFETEDFARDLMSYCEMAHSAGFTWTVKQKMSDPDTWVVLVEMDLYADDENGRSINDEDYAGELKAYYGFVKIVDNYVDSQRSKSDESKPAPEPAQFIIGELDLSLRTDDPDEDLRVTLVKTRESGGSGHEEYPWTKADAKYFADEVITGIHEHVTLPEGYSVKTYAIPKSWRQLPSEDDEAWGISVVLYGPPAFNQHESYTVAC